MRRFFAVAAVVALVLVAFPTASLGETPPEDITFEVDTDFLNGATGGPFEATGPAVTAGLVCATGDTIDVFAKASGFQSGRGFNIQVVKLFTCDDGSGDFEIKLQVRIDQKGTNFNWTIVGGTGAYERLHGSGDGVGLPPPDGTDGVFDVYTGKVHID